jgi:hypothetical protein
MVYNDISLLWVIYEEVVHDIFVLSVAMTSEVISHSDCILTITQERDFTQIVSKVLYGLPHLK